MLVKTDVANLYRGKKVTVIGMGRSGQAVAKLLNNIGAKVFCSDSSDVQGLGPLGLPFEAGGHSERVFDADYMVVSPGIPLNAPVLLRAREMGIPLVGELDFAASLLSCPYAAVTGTSGKSTTTALIAHMMNKAGTKSRPVGNIGDALSNHVEVAARDWVMSIEVSSFQCELMETFHPKAAVFTNLSEDHLNRHGSMDAYGALKEKMMAKMAEDDLAVLNLDDTWSAGLAHKTNAKSAFFSSHPNLGARAFVDGDWLCVQGERVSNFEEYKLIGDYNKLNLLAASLAVSRFGVEPKKALISAKDFGALPHRTQLVGVFGGVSFINDSKATKPESTILTLHSISGPFILILGGSEKGSDFSVLPSAMGQVKLAIVHGQTSKRISQALKEAGFERFLEVSTQHDAVLLAFDKACEGDVVLLSPSCASFDQFKDYEHRGRVFCQEVREIAQKRQKA